MPVLFTPRLILLPLTAEIMAQRLREADFTLPVQLPGGVLDVHFGLQWPGDPLDAFPFFLTLTDERGTLPGSFVAVERGTGEAAGMLGAKGLPDEAGIQEIGYGFIPACWGQGYATEAVEALLPHLLQQPEIREITAWTATANAASQRVLQKAGFSQSGNGWNEEDGHLLGWTYNAR